MRGNGGGRRGPTLDIWGRHGFELVREQRGKAIVMHKLKSIDDREDQMSCDRKQNNIGHILERGHGGENLLDAAIWYWVDGRLA